MENTTVLVLFLVLVLLYKFRKLTNQYWNFFRKINKLPKSKCNFFFGHIWQVLGNRNKVLREAGKILDNSPPTFVVWLGPVPGFSVLHSEDLEVVLSSPKHIEKPFIYSFFKPWLGSGLLVSTGSKWHTRRKMLTPAFHFSILENFIEVFAEKSHILVEKLNNKVGSEKFDIVPDVTMCSLDIICKTAMGVEVSAQELGEESEYVKAVCNITDDVMNRFLSPWLYPDLLFNLFPSGRRFKKYCRTLHDFTNKVIQQRRKEYLCAAKDYQYSDDYYLGRKKKMAFLDLLLENSNSGLTDEDVREEVDTIMFEGHDTTTSAMCWALQMLATHMDVQNKVLQEIEDIFKGSQTPAHIKDLNEMKYLERVIKETLRLYPSVPIIGRLPREDFEIGENFIPSGLMIGMPVFYTHRDPKNFPNPEKFDPDNFLPERVAARHPYAYIPFSAGSRNCIGQKFAMLEMKMVLSTILRHFELHATGDVPTPLPQMILRPENGVQLRITPRSY